MNEQHPSVSAALRQRFRARSRIYGAWLSIGSAEVASIFAAAKGHFVGIDLEHTTIDLPTTQMIIRACHEHGRAALPRIFPGDLQQARRLLDGGADGLIVPQISTRSQIQSIVECMRYPPLGKRGFGVAAAQQYGRGFDEYVQSANEALSLMIQVETAEGIANIEEIVSHPDVDAVMIGPYDLSGSLGIPGQLKDKRVAAACDTVIGACERYRVSCGFHLVYPGLEEVREHFSKGFTFLVLGSDIFNLWKRSEEMDQVIEELGEL